MGLLSRRARAALSALSALLLGLWGALSAGTAQAAGIVAQAQTNAGPLAPPIVFILLLALLFVAVIVFSLMAYRDAR